MITDCSIRQNANTILFEEDLLLYNNALYLLEITQFLNLF